MQNKQIVLKLKNDNTWDLLYIDIILSKLFYCGRNKTTLSAEEYIAYKIPEDYNFPSPIVVTFISKLGSEVDIPLFSLDSKFIRETIKHGYPTFEKYYGYINNTSLFYVYHQGKKYNGIKKIFSDIKEERFYYSLKQRKFTQFYSWDMDNVENSNLIYLQNNVFNTKDIELLQKQLQETNKQLEQTNKKLLETNAKLEFILTHKESIKELEIIAENIKK